MNQIEICVDSVKSAIAAADGGADAVELCSSGLLEGGITPSLALIESVIAKVGHRLFVNVLIRCRAGDFLYGDEEISVMLRDIELCRQAGAHGVVVGALLPCGSIDTAALQRFCSAAGPLKVTFHRAFDLASDASATLEVLIQCGVARLLTSGQQANVIQGIPCLKALVEQSRGRIQIAAGGGINADNVALLISATGVTEVHASARVKENSLMEFRRGGVFMGGEKHNTKFVEFGQSFATATSVSALRNALLTI